MTHLVRRHIVVVLVASAVASLSGCVVGPDFVRPALATPDHYLSDGVDTAQSSEQRIEVAQQIPVQWYQAFHSTEINALVDASLKDNPNGAAARAALRVAQENMLAQRGAYFPNASASFVPTRQKSASTLASPIASNANIYNLFTAQVAVSFAPDVFGLNRRQVESLQAQAEQERFQLEATYLTLTSNVVNGAIAEASLRAQIAATEQLIAGQRQTLAVIQNQRNLGQLADSDVLVQESLLAATEASLPALQKQLGAARDLLVALAGRYPGSGALPAFTLDSVTLPETLPLTLPAALVEQRPDIRAAEAQLHAASAEVGVAVANRLPNISLGVDTWGSATQSLSELFKPGTGFWTLAAGVTQPIFDAGTLAHRQSAAQANFEQSEALYRATVINAFQNVADVLQAIRADSDALTMARRAQGVAIRSLQISQQQFALGDVSTLTVVAAEQAVHQAQINTVIAQTSRLEDSVALFQALGGDWWTREGEPGVQPLPKPVSGS